MANLSGLCKCGCGNPAPIAPDSNRKKGIRKGDYRDYISGHNARGKRRRVGITEEDYVLEYHGYLTDCWVWVKTISPKGYGAVWNGSQVEGAHRVSYRQAYGPIPEGKQLDHLCRNRACVNPEHLQAVTQWTNQRRGLNAKLTDANRTEMFALSAEGWTAGELGERYGVSGQSIVWALKQPLHPDGKPHA